MFFDQSYAEGIYTPPPWLARAFLGPGMAYTPLLPEARRVYTPSWGPGQAAPAASSAGGRGGRACPGRGSEAVPSGALLEDPRGAPGTLDLPGGLKSSTGALGADFQVWRAIS